MLTLALLLVCSHPHANNAVYTFNAVPWSCDRAHRILSHVNPTYFV